MLAAGHILNSSLTQNNVVANPPINGINLTNHIVGAIDVGASASNNFVSNDTILNGLPYRR
jgi:hypothetical protein